MCYVENECGCGYPKTGEDCKRCLPGHSLRHLDRGQIACDPDCTSVSNCTSRGVCILPGVCDCYSRSRNYLRAREKSRVPSVNLASLA